MIINLVLHVVKQLTFFPTKAGISETFSPRMLMIGTDKHAESIRNLIGAVHDAGGRIVVQINHAGRQTSSGVTGSPIVGPSPIPALPSMEIPRELSPGEIEALVDRRTEGRLAGGAIARERAVRTQRQRFVQIRPAAVVAVAQRDGPAPSVPPSVLFFLFVQGSTWCP